MALTKEQATLLANAILKDAKKNGYKEGTPKAPIILKKVK